MNCIRYVAKIVGCVLVVGVLVPPRVSRAEPMLLVEMHNTGDCFDCSPAGADFEFNALVSPFEFTQLRAQWSIFATPANVGETFSMPAELIPDFNKVLADARDIFGSLRCCGTPGGGHTFSTPALNQTTTGGDFITVTRVAPNLGPNLFGYFVTGITQTVDELIFTQLSTTLFRGDGSHTVRIYGEPVPEPNNWFLLTIWTFIWPRSRIRLAG